MNVLENLPKEINEYFHVYKIEGIAGGFMFLDDLFYFACDKVNIQNPQQEKTKIEIQEKLNNLGFLINNFVENKNYEIYQKENLNMDELCFLSKHVYLEMRNYFSINQLLGKTLEDYFDETFNFLEKKWSKETSKLFGLPETVSVWPENKLQRKLLINAIEETGVDCSKINYKENNFNSEIKAVLKKQIDVVYLFKYIADSDGSSINYAMKYRPIVSIVVLEEILKKTDVKEKNLKI